MPNSETTSSYRLKEGKKHNHNGVNLSPGDVVELTKAQARAFRDKFDLVSEPTGEQKQTSVQEISQHGMINKEEAEKAADVTDSDETDQPKVPSPIPTSTIPNPYNATRRTTTRR